MTAIRDKVKTGKERKRVLKRNYNFALELSGLYNWFSQRRESQYVRQSDHNRVTLITVAITQTNKPGQYNGNSRNITQHTDNYTISNPFQGHPSQHTEYTTTTDVTTGPTVLFNDSQVPTTET
ncbi:conserved hypothetical protein [Trichinella spiralis]|uniref:hypothetical protein n=1 Tax=Trichinella spiralis TaxID=6334 RepID=UPI0001EFDFE3|nr:conserved hypothetical protein [Trichinella spiralis]XP_003369415.1 conserved hypothetical protein [Trichinella spiralis]